ncbi:MAG: LamG-like jellyroll fold domain-containing protein [Candidatus Aquilonibacter sp.]
MTLITACSGGSGVNSGNPLPNSSALSETNTTATAQSTSALITGEYESVVLADDPAAFYTLRGSGSTALDSGPKGLTGTVGSGITSGVTGLLAGSTDTALDFPGAQSAAGAVRVPAASALQPSAQESLETWFKFSTTPTDFTVVAAYGKTSGTATYELYFKGGELHAQVMLGSGYLGVASAALSAGKIYHAVETYNGSTLQLYINGALVATSAAQSGTLSYQSGYGFSIGDDDTSTNPAFSGTIGDVAIYTNALSAAQIAKHYASGTDTLATPTPAPTATPTAKPTADPTAAPTASPSGTVVWEAGSATLGKWEAANTYQCGSPSVSATTTSFTLSQGSAPGGGHCGRNQLQPLNASGGLSQLTPGQSYTWTFQYDDSAASGSGQGMGLDCHAGAKCGNGVTTGCPGTSCVGDARSSVWQIHGDGETNSPCTELGFANGSNGASSPQVWAFYDCGTGSSSQIEWTGSYTAGETDNWKITVVVSDGNTGSVQLYRNGTLVYSKSSISTYTDSPSGNPWWDYGIYKWIWENAPNDSSLSIVNFTIKNMEVTTP